MNLEPNLSNLTEVEWNFLKSHTLNLDSAALAEIFPDFVNYEKRQKTEIPFLRSQFPTHLHPHLLNACLGSGATTFGLYNSGLTDIISNEIDPEFITIANDLAKDLQIPLTITQYDWRDLAHHFTAEFEAVLCLGNSLTYLFKREDQISAIQNFKSVLKPGGKLFIDERNYAEHFLNGPFTPSGRYVYCGIDKVEAKPIFVSEHLVVLQDRHLQKGTTAHLLLYPFKDGEMEGLLAKAGFSGIEKFADYQHPIQVQRPDFFTYVCTK